MKTMTVHLCVVVLLVASGVVLSGHHSIAAVYDATNPVSLDGTVTSFHFVNPHPFVMVEAAGETWHLEMDNLGELQAVGVTRTTFRAGDHVLITASRSRTPERRGYIRKLVRPSDGFEYEQVGFSPRIRTR